MGIRQRKSRISKKQMIINKRRGKVPLPNCIIQKVNDEDR
jgi:hypothetical protein